MSVSGIGTAGYPVMGYDTRRTERTVPQKQFSDVVSEKAAAKKDDFDEKAFEQVAPNAPEKVKNAWIEAAKEVNANGLGIRGNGMLSHISQMMIQRIVGWYNGKENFTDVLGSSVESAISATKQALYNLDNPLEPTHKSIEVQQAQIKEREFYKAFISKLEQL